MQRFRGSTSGDYGEAEPANHGVGLPKPSGGLFKTFESLRNSNYRWLWLSMLASFAGLHMQMIARGWLVVEMTDSPLILGLVSSAFAIPLLIFSLFGGVIADRLPKRNLLIFSQSSIFIISLVIAILIHTETIAVWHLVTAALLLGAVFSFNMPARQAIIPELVGEQSLMNAIALNSAAMNLTRVAAPALAGLLVGIVGVSGVYWIVTGCYVVSIGSLSMIRVTAKKAVKPSTSMRKDLVAGLSFVRHNPTILTLLTMAIIPVVFGMSYQMLMPIFARNVLDVGASGYGALMSAAGLGALIGSLGIASIGNFQRKGLLLLGFGLVFGVTLILFSISSVFSLSLVILVGVGIGSTGYMALNNTLIQLKTPSEMRGRVMSLFMMTVGLVPLGTLPSGAIAEVTGVAPVVGVSGAILLVFMVVMALTQPRVRKLT
ncbi:MFS transporter [Chloroflexota bacterium]